MGWLVPLKDSLACAFDPFSKELLNPSQNSLILERKFIIPISVKLFLKTALRKLADPTLFSIILKTTPLGQTRSTIDPFLHLVC